MNIKQLSATAQAMMAEPKGLLAMDESHHTIHQRFAKSGIAQTEENRRAYRELLVTTPKLGDYVSGTILYDETIRQKKKDGTPFVKVLNEAGIIPGIKVDEGAHEMAGFPGEEIVEGLDGLRGRLKEYAGLGARFAKWRAVILIGDAIPSPGCVEANMHALAHYAALCQEAGIVPIVEPDVVLDGTHTLERCLEVTEEVQHALFRQLYAQRVRLEGTILKPSMVTSGKGCPKQAGIDEVADATFTCLSRAVPAAIAGVAFLSGGQPTELATAHLSAINAKYKSKAPWVLTFSFARALHQAAMDVWKGQEANVASAQRALLHRAKCLSAARRGQYTQAMESERG